MAPGLGDILRRLGGGGGGSSQKAAAKAAFPPTQYNGYTITPVPKREDGHWLIAGTISREVDDGVREHRFLRGDRYPDADSAAEFTIFKAQQMIDLEGDRLFQRVDAPE